MWDQLFVLCSVWGRFHLLYCCHLPSPTATCCHLLPLVTCFHLPLAVTYHHLLPLAVTVLSPAGCHLPSPRHVLTSAVTYFPCQPNRHAVTFLTSVTSVTRPAHRRHLPLPCHLLVTCCHTTFPACPVTVTVSCHLCHFPCTTVTSCHVAVTYITSLLSPHRHLCHLAVSYIPLLSPNRHLPSPPVTPWSPTFPPAVDLTLSPSRSCHCCHYLTSRHLSPPVTCYFFPAVTYRHLPLAVTYFPLSPPVTYRCCTPTCHPVTSCHLLSTYRLTYRHLVPSPPVSLHCHLLSPAVTYLPSPTVTSCHLLSPTFPLCHLPSPPVTSCHLLSLAVTYFPLPPTVTCLHLVTTFPAVTYRHLPSPPVTCLSLAVTYFPTLSPNRHLLPLAVTYFPLLSPTVTCHLLPPSPALRFPPNLLAMITA
ncbi:hypothetical protein C7M84_016845 [Penaeus vannamei]|uniref:Uncharacterized protein n=1 Tax=Penaeus vannamei TaxID=6689 RepID=A0A3R7PFW2_PENVA|nr:hypothetical protein C7M84_016845 [Penaeus vannamei]